MRSLISSICCFCSGGLCPIDIGFVLQEQKLEGTLLEITVHD